MSQIRCKNSIENNSNQSIGYQMFPYIKVQITNLNFHYKTVNNLQLPYPHKYIVYFVKATKPNLLPNLENQAHC